MPRPICRLRQPLLATRTKLYRAWRGIAVIRFAARPQLCLRYGALELFGCWILAAILTIPSLVNGSEIMDLTPRQSPLRWLAGQGFRVFQVDWGVPGPAEKRFDLGDYLDQRLIPALDVVMRLIWGVR